MIDIFVGDDEVKTLISGLAKSHRVFAPVNSGGATLFKRVASGNEVYLDYSNSLRPPKDVLFPQSEPMFAYRWDKQGTITFEDLPAEEEPTVLLGIRPCDVAAVRRLDMVFMEGAQPDESYARRRQKTTLVSLACDQPETTCFCTSVGGGPFESEGADAMLFRLPDGYGFRLLSEKGEALVAGRGLPVAGPSVAAPVDEGRQMAESALVRFDLSGLDVTLSTMFDSPFWAELHEKCLGCAACTYLCPTCHCFDLVDETSNSQGLRVRTWDSCMFPSFTLQASGVNPRPTHKERMRQRIMHKFKYFVDNFGKPACVGCGRCVRSCPVNMDIRSVLSELRMRQMGPRRVDR